jgi:acylpyruvate hydrolase
MKLVTYSWKGRPALGALTNGQVVDLRRAQLKVAEVAGTSATGGTVPADLLEFLRGGEKLMSTAREELQFALERGAADGARLGHPVSEVEVLAPIQRPGKIICVGLNYRSHLAEIGEPVPAYPILFDKPATSIIGHEQAIVVPRVSRQVDFEGELAVVIGRTGKYILEENALDFVAGYTCANDVSAHDIEFRTSQWTSGKMLDTFCPLGPVLLTQDEAPDPRAFRLKTMLNGQFVQEEGTWDMIFSVPFLISYISSLATLEPGDIILTGTPAGIGCNQKPQFFLKAGDRISVQIGGIGTLANPVVGEEGR